MCVSLGSSKQVVQDQSHRAFDIDQHYSPSQEVPKPIHQVARFRQYQSTIQLVPKSHIKKGDLNMYQILLQRILLCVVSTHTVCILWSGSILRVNKPEG